MKYNTKVSFGAIARLEAQAVGWQVLRETRKIEDAGKSCIENFPIYGGVAHLGERLNGIQEVRGSIPLISTKIG